MDDTTEDPSTPSERHGSSYNPLQDNFLPSPGFTLSSSPSSPGGLTPTSSRDSSVEREIDQRSITPTMQFLLEDLLLTEGQRRTTSEPESNFSNGQGVSRLASTTQQTTYRDLYNASPIPESTSSTGPPQRPRTPNSLLRVVRSDFQNLNITVPRGAAGEGSEGPDRDSSLAVWYDNDNDDDNGHLQNVWEDELPRAPIYNTRLQNALRNVRGQLTGLAQFMGGHELVQDPTSALHGLYEQTLTASRFAYPARRTVGFIGNSGIGKSSVINSILGENGLARSSGDEAACTTVVTEFRNVDEEYPDDYTVKAELMDNVEIRELLEELLSNVRRYYTDAYREVTDLDEQENIRTAATRAWETFRCLFPHRPELDLDFLSRAGEDAAESIVSTLEEWAIARLNNQPGGQNRLEEPRVARHADECRYLLDNLMADTRGGESPALWPFFKLIRVYLRSPILRTGLVLADLPGLRDLNYARVRATETYLRHSCDEVFIVSTITRCTTDESISDIIGRCAENQPIQLICTHSEAVNAEEAARTASAAEAMRIRNLNGRVQGLDQRIRSTRSRRRQSTGRRRQSLAEEETNLSDQREAAKLELDRFLITRRNRRVTNSLMRSWGTRARVFCVSNGLYSDHRAQGLDQANAYLELSGIRELRRYCQSVPADAQLRATEAFLQIRVPALLGSLSAWAAAGSETITHLRAEVLRDVLNQAEQSLQRRITSPRSEIHLLQSLLERQFRNLITRTIRNPRNNWREGAVTASRDWEDWPHQTYAAWCRNNGTYRTRGQAFRCWNKEVLGRASTQLRTRWDTMRDLLEEQNEILDDEIYELFEEIYVSIEAHQTTAPHTIRNLISNLITRERCITDAIHGSLEDLLDATAKFKLDSIGGHNSSYIAGVMRPVYNSCREQYGEGSDARRKQTMNRHLTSSPLFATFANRISADYWELMDRTFNRLSQKLRDEVCNFQGISRSIGNLRLWLACNLSTSKYIYLDIIYGGTFEFNFIHQRRSL